MARLERKTKVKSTIVNYLTKHPKLLQFSFVLVVFFLLCFTINPSENNIFWRLPPLIAWLPIWINDVVEFLLHEWMPIEYFDSNVEEVKTRPLVLHITRAISRSMLFLIELIREIILGGRKTIVAFQVGILLLKISGHVCQHFLGQ